MGTEAAVQPERGSPPRTVLLVEDDDDIRDALIEVLTGFGWSVVGVANGQEALSYLRAHPAPRLILLDLMMPVMNGYQFRAYQQQHTPLSQIPVVLLSAHNNVAADAAELGVAGYLRKPIDVDALVALVERHSS